MGLYLGIDFGTSGARAVVIDRNGQIQAQAQYPFPSGKSTPNDNWISVWQAALFTLIEQTCKQIQSNLNRTGGIAQLTRIAIDGTSATVLLCNSTGTPLDTPILYNDSRGASVLDKLAAIVPPHHVTLSATSSLAKLAWWLETLPTLNPKLQAPIYLLHQADWLAFLLHGKLGISDYHNTLKLGYDVGNLCYPDWLAQLSHPVSHPVTLPQVVAPGTPIAQVTPDIARRFGLSPDCQVCAGTTDSIAAFLASGVTSPGEAVTSLGSTLVLKLLSRTRVDDGRYGIYSHRLGDLWLTGGASNTGGAVLRQYFTDEELAHFSQKIGDRESPLDYYPLLQPGERFPINDAQLAPRLEPKPEDAVDFLHGMLESMARIEARGYELLQELGATPLTRVYTAGGGAKNAAWQRLRQRHLQVPVRVSAQTDAAYGAALLAKGRRKNSTIRRDGLPMR